MILPESIRTQVANRMVRVIAPVIIVSVGAMCVGTFLVGDGQYFRLAPMSMVLFPSILAWILAVKGRPKTGAGIILVSFSLAILAALILSGGVRAPGYLASVMCLTMFIVLYGTWGGIIFALAAFALGGLVLVLTGTGVIPKVPELPDVYYWLTIGIYLLIQFWCVLIPVRLMYQILAERQNKEEALLRAVQAQQQSQRELQSILNKTPDIIYRLNPEGEFTFISDAVKKYGARPQDFIGRPILDFVHPADQAAAMPMLHERRSGNRGSTDLEVRLLMKPGLPGFDPEAVSPDIWGTFHVSSEGVYTETAPGESSYGGTQGIARDISETKRYESQITRLAAVIEQASEDVIITDAAGVIQYVNPKFEALTGYSRNEAIGKKPNIVKSGKHDLAFYRDLWATIKAGRTWNGKIWNRIRDGGVILQDVTITPIFDASRQIAGFASVRRDITEQEQFEERLEQSRRMEAIGTLAGGIAHDFNNILGAILGYSELALSELEDRDAVRLYVDQILKAGERATDLVRQILLFSRQTKQEKQPVRITILAKEVIKLLRATLPAGINITTVFSDDAWLVMSDPAQIHQIFMNLCTNAAHAMKARGGTLSIRIENTGADEIPPGSIGTLSPGRYLKIGISDTGHGIPEDIREKIFDPFFTTKSREEGTGMGLAVVYGIVDGHGGAIHVKSDAAGGTTFSIFLPAIAPGVKESVLPEKRIPRGDEHLMFVDDEPALSALGEAILTRLGYEVTVFSDSQKAWEAFAAGPDRFDLVITDNSMPGMSGLELSRKIIAVRPDIPVIMCTGFSADITRSQADRIGIRRLLNKPIVSKDIGVAIREVLDR